MSNSEPSKPLSYSGYCDECKTTHSLPPEKAIAHSYILMQQLRGNERLDLEIALENVNARLSTKPLYQDVGGEMMGVLVCEDENGGEVILKAFSSTHNGIWNVNGWVPHLANENLFMDIVEQANLEIHPLTEAIAALSMDAEELNLLLLKRKKVSQETQSKLHALYEITNFKNKKSKLNTLFDRKTGIPNGTGDCCAPKLLNYAALNNLKPISIAEFYWGKTTKSGNRIEGNFYSSCTQKCEPILGFMLCGL